LSKENSSYDDILPPPNLPKYDNPRFECGFNILIIGFEGCARRAEDVYLYNQANAKQQGVT